MALIRHDRLEGKSVEIEGVNIFGGAVDATDED